MCHTLKTATLTLLFLLTILAATPVMSTSPQSTLPSSGSISYPKGMQWIYVEENVIRTKSGPFFLIGCNVRSQARNPKTEGKYDDWYTYRELDAANIASYGFNTIRLMTYWECIETSKSPSEFTYDDAYIEKIRQTIETYNQHGIYVIINLHEHGSVNVLGNFVPTLGNDIDFADAFYSNTSSTSAREHLKRLWLRLSETFKDTPGIAGYDLCNEPHRSSGSLSNQQVADFWYDIADYVVNALRANGDNHTAFVNFSPWARYANFMSRKLVDTNVVYEPHFYYGINEADLTVSNNDYSWLKQQFDTYENTKMLEFNVPFVMGEQGFGGSQISTGDALDVWLRNTLNISETSSLMQGWLYFCYIAYNGVAQGGGWQSTLIEYFSDKPI